MNFLAGGWFVEDLIIKSISELFQNVKLNLTKQCHPQITTLSAIPLLCVWYQHKAYNTYSLGIRKSSQKGITDNRTPNQTTQCTCGIYIERA